MRSSLAVVIGLALGGSLVLAMRSARSDGPSEDSMATTAPVGSNAPPIDRKVPAKVETATFALG